MEPDSDGQAAAEAELARHMAALPRWRRALALLVRLTLRALAWPTPALWRLHDRLCGFEAKSRSFQPTHSE